MYRQRERRESRRQFHIAHRAACAMLLLALGFASAVPPLYAQIVVPELTELPDQQLISRSVQFPEQTANGDSVLPTINFFGKAVAFQSNAIDVVELPDGPGGPIIPPIPEQIFFVGLTGDPRNPIDPANPGMVISLDFQNGELGNGPSFAPSISPGVLGERRDDGARKVWK